MYKTLLNVKNQTGLAVVEAAAARHAEGAGTFGALAPRASCRWAPIAAPVLRRRTGRAVRAAPVARCAKVLAPPWRFGVIGAAPVAGPVV